MTMSTGQPTFSGKYSRNLSSCMSTASIELVSAAHESEQPSTRVLFPGMKQGHVSYRYKLGDSTRGFN